MLGYISDYRETQVPFRAKGLGAFKDTCLVGCLHTAPVNVELGAHMPIWHDCVSLAAAVVITGGCKETGYVPKEPGVALGVDFFSRDVSPHPISCTERFFPC
eukprot:163173-Amphidinium_carterae.1